jgi:hypothetical protein
MRLNQLARQIGVEPKDILKVLKKHNIEISDHPNTKVEEDQIELVKSELEQPVEVEVEEKKPERSLVASIMDEKPSDEIEEKQVIEAPEIPSEPVLAESEPAAPQETPNEIVAEVEEPQKVVSDEESENTEEPVVATEETSVTSEGDKSIEIQVTDTRKFREDLPSAEEIAATSNDVIKAPKVKLQGTTVVGKIDLPEDPRRKAIEEQRAAEAAEKEEEEAMVGPFIHPNKIAKQKGKEIADKIATVKPQEKSQPEAKKKKKVIQEEVKGASRPKGNSKKSKTEQERDYIPIWDPKRDESKKPQTKKGKPVEQKVEQKGGFGKFLDWLFDRNGKY